MCPPRHEGLPPAAAGGYRGWALTVIYSRNPRRWFWLGRERGFLAGRRVFVHIYAVFFNCWICYNMDAAGGQLPLGGESPQPDRTDVSIIA